MKKIIKAVVLASMLTGVTSTYAQTIGVVNGKPVDDKYSKFIANQMQAKGMPAAMVNEKELAVKVLIAEALYQEASKDTSLSQSETFKTKVELATRDALISEYLEKYTEKNPVTEAELKAAYTEYSTKVATQKDAKGEAIKPQPYESAKEMLKSKLKSEKVSKYIEELKEKAVKVSPAITGKAPVSTTK